MAYLLSQMWLCLLITALISGLLGWLFRGGGKHKLRALNTQWQDKYDALSQERNSYASKINKSAGMSHENDRLERKIEAQKKSFDETVKHLNKDLVSADNEMQQQELLLTQKDEELAMSMAQFDKKITEFEDEKQVSNTVLEKTLTEEKLLNNELQKNIEKQRKSNLQSAQVEANNNKQLQDYQQQTSKLETELESTLSELVTSNDKLKTTKKELIATHQEVDHLKKDLAVKSSEVLSLQKKSKKKTESEKLVRTGKEQAKANLHQANNSITQQAEVNESILPIHTIQALSEEDSQRLSSMNIKTTHDLAIKTSTDTGIRLLSKSLGKEEWVVRTWANNADLIRIQGVDGILAELLELSGIDSVTKLANLSPDTLSKSITTVHKHIAKRSELPSLDALQTLIKNAKKLL